jgi:hypothetical protein
MPHSIGKKLGLYEILSPGRLNALLGAAGLRR